MIAATQLRLVLVTPETTLLDTPARALRFPLYDGQLGVLPGRAPMVGRLGQGELRVETPAGVEHFYVEGGFVQIKGGVVTLLTSRAVALEDIDVAAAQQELEAALAMTPTTEEEHAEKRRAMERGRNMLTMKRRM